MARVSAPICTFDAGEWGPELYGRFDLPKYLNAQRLISNFINLAYGPATRRPGTRFVAETKDSKPADLIPFVFSTIQAYQIEATDQLFRFYRNRGRLESPPGTPVEVAVPYLEAEIGDLKWTQSADVLYLAHPKYQPRKLTRTSATAFSISLLDFRDGPYLDVNITATTLQPSAASGAGITITASAVAGINDGAGFKATDVGRLIRILHGSTWGYAKIVGFTDTTHVTADVKSNFGATTAQATWRLGAWSETTGWPAAITFHEERLWFANTASQPQTLWGSVSGDYENFLPSSVSGGLITADNALNWTISDDRVNAIIWMSAGRQLNVGTIGGEFTVQASSLNEGLTPTNITVRRDGTLGSVNILPLRINNQVLFVQRAARRMHELSYSFNDDAYVASEATIFARHLFQDGITRLAYQQEPWGIVWACTNDGALRGMTYLRDERQQILKEAWHRHQLGGTDVKVLSISVIPGETQDELWLVVERTINGTTKRYVEFMEDEFLPADSSDKAECFFVDCGLSYDGEPATTMSGLGHLEGETVQILADGATHPDKVVTGGQVILEREASKAQIGLGSRAELETMDLEAGSQDGAAAGKPKRVSRVYVRFANTLGGKIGRPALRDRNGNLEPETMEEIQFRGGSDPMDSSPPLFTGDKKVTFPGGWNASAIIRAVQEQPLPMTLLALVPQLTTIDG